MIWRTCCRITGCVVNHIQATRGTGPLEEDVPIHNIISSRGGVMK